MSRFVISEEPNYPAVLCQDLAEINAEHGTDAQIVFEQLALRLERRCFEALKAKRTPGKGGRPKRQQIDVKELIELRGRRSQARFAELLGISHDNLSRAEKDGLASKDTRRAINRYRKQNAAKKPTQKSQ